MNTFSQRPIVLLAINTTRVVHKTYDHAHSWLQLMTEHEKYVHTLNTLEFLEQIANLLESSLCAEQTPSALSMSS